MVDWPPVPSDEEIMAAHAEKWRGVMFWQENYEHLRHKCPDQWVAVLRDGTVLTATDDVWKLDEVILEAAIDRREIWSRFVCANPSPFILSPMRLPPSDPNVEPDEVAL